MSDNINENNPGGISEAKLEANRRNSLNSTGATSQEGKDAVSGNALKDGLHARDPKHLVQEGEKLAELETLRQEVMALYRPECQQEREHLEQYATAMWLMRRIPRIMTRIEEENEEFSAGYNREFDVLCRNVTRLERRMKVALMNFERVRELNREAQAAGTEDSEDEPEVEPLLPEDREAILKALAEHRRKRVMELTVKINQGLSIRSEREEMNALKARWPFTGPEPDDAELALFCKNRSGPGNPASGA